MALPVLSAAGVGLDALRVNPLRTVLSTLGVIIGVGALVSVLSLGDGMERFARGQLEQTTDVQSVTIQAKSGEWRDGTWEPVRDYPVFTTRDAREIAEQVPLVSTVAMFLSGRARVSWARTGRERQATLTAATAGSEDFARLKFAEGRFFTASEASRNALVVVLSFRLAEELAAGRRAESMIGELVRVRGVPREVIGVLASVRGERGYGAHVPYAAAASVFGADVNRDRPQILVQARDVESVDAMRRGLEDWLGARYARWEDRVEILAQEQRLEQVTQGIRVMKLFLGSLAGISLLVSGIGIMNIMLANVTERTREIGVRKAIGARGVDIQLQFLTESVAVSSFGSALGVVLGVTISAVAISVIRRLTGAEGLALSVSLGTMMVAALSAISIGLIFGTYPARRAARLSPIDAIRHE